ncbi:MAG: CARDB domain-containing protein [Candidatus Bipolaricaulia bacterium]
MTKRASRAWLVIAAVVAFVSVLVEAKPDLIVASVEIRPSVPFPGSVAALVARVENVGDDRSSSSVFVLFSVDDVEVGSATIAGGMEAHTQREVSVPWTAVGGPHIVTVAVDQPQSRVRESRETNNTASITVFIPWTAASPNALGGLRIAVAEFIDRSDAGFVNMGAGVADNLADRLAELGVVVVERGELEGLLQGRSLDPFREENLILAARELGVDLVVTGAVDAVSVGEVALTLGLVRFVSESVDVRASARLLDVRAGTVVSSISAEGHEQGATAASAGLNGFLGLAKGYDVCGGGLRSDDDAYSVGETVPIGYANPGDEGWFSVEIYDASDQFLSWLGWRFVGAGQCGTWFWDQQDELGSQVGSGVYRAKLWNGATYAAVAGFQVRPGRSAAAPPIGEITVGEESFDRTIAGMAVRRVIEQLTASVLSAMADDLRSESAATPGEGVALPLSAPATPVRIAQVAATLPDGRVAINIGSSSGVAVGDRFEILSVANLVLDPQGLGVVSFDTVDTKGEIEIVEVRELVAYGVCLSEFQPGIGDVARWVTP